MPDTFTMAPYPMPPHSFFFWSDCSDCTAKVEAIKQADEPNSVSDVRSLFGMANDVARFIRNYADIVAHLRDLTHKDVEFK